jgi:hypothetical protein
VPRTVVDDVDDHQIALLLVQASPAPDHLGVQELRLCRSRHQHAVDAGLVESLGEHVAVRQDGDFPVSKPAETFSTLLLGHSAPDGCCCNPTLLERGGERVHVGDVDTEDHRSPTWSEAKVRLDDELVALRYVDCPCKIALDEVAVAHPDSSDVD